MQLSKLRTILGLTGLLFFTAPSYVMGQGYRQHDAHEHGVAQLNIAQQGNTLHLELTSPAMNIVGFEHAPRNAKQRQAIQQAVADLNKGADLFVLDSEAKCTLQDVTVETGLLSSQADHGHDEHKHDKKEPAADTSHADFEARYVFQCQHASALKGIMIKLFSHFPATTELAVQLLSDSGQTARHLSAANPYLPFK